MGEPIPERSILPLRRSPLMMSFRPFRFATAIRITVKVVFGMAACLVAVAALTAWENHRSRTLPRPTGRYDVGRRFVSWRDETRIEELALALLAARLLIVSGAVLVGTLGL